MCNIITNKSLLNVLSHITYNTSLLKLTPTYNLQFLVKLLLKENLFPQALLTNEPMTKDSEYINVGNENQSLFRS